MTEQFQLRVFGQPELRDPESLPVAFRTKKQLALLVYLHLEGRERSVGRDELVELLWPEVPHEKGRHSLSQACTAIRERLGPEALERRGEQLRLVTPLASDVDVLHSPEARPLDLTMALKDLDRAGGVEFAHWVERGRGAVTRQARTALFEAVKQARARGDLHTAYHAAHRLLPIDPTCAMAVQVLAERTLLDGDTIGAIRTLREYVAQVEQDVGTNPHPEITRLLRRLEQGNGPPLMTSPAPGKSPPARREVFVGRERELEALEARWARSAETQYQACLITGPAGIGKSSVLRRFAATVAARACPVFLVACQEIGQGIPFAAASDLIRALARDPGSSGTDPHWLAEASRVSPGLRATYPGIPEPPDAPADSVRLRVAEALHRMLEAVVEGTPVLLAFDDMQHMDHASLDVLFLLTRRLDTVRVLLAATERRDEGRPMRPAGGDARAQGLGWNHVVELEPLPNDHALALVAGLSASDGQVTEPIRDKIVSLGQGNPYHIEMLLSDFRQHAVGSLVGADDEAHGPAPDWRPPETMRLAFARHYEGLSTDAQRVLHVLAVAGRAMEVSEITGMLGLEGTARDRTVLEIVESGVIRVEGGRFYFKNELHRAYVYWAVPLEARKYHHGRLGAAFAASGSHGDFQRSLEGSHHFIRAGMREEAVAAAVGGSEVAVARGAMKEAERTLKALVQAYPEHKEPRVQLLLATALVAEGRNKEALDELALWDPLAGGEKDRSTAALLKAEALHRGRLADDSQIGLAAGEAANAARSCRSETALARALQIQAEFAFDIGNTNAIKNAAEDAQRLASTTHKPDAKALALFTTGYCSLAVSDFESGADTFAAVVPRLDHLSLKVELRRALNGIGMCDTATGGFDRAVGAFQRAIQIAAELGDHVSESNTWSNLSALYHDLGMYDRATQACCRALALHGVASSRVSVDPLINAALIAADLGGFSHGDNLLTLATHYAERSRLWQDEISVLLAKAQTALVKGAAENAWPFVDEALTLSRNRMHLAHPDLGLYYRLEAQYVLNTKGADAFEALVSSWHAQTRRLRIADELERRAFVEWARTGPGGPGTPHTAYDELVKRRLYGRLARLESGVTHFLPSHRFETRAQAVLRLFPDDAQQVLPSPDDLIRAADALQRSS